MCQTRRLADRLGNELTDHLQIKSVDEAAELLRDISRYQHLSGGENLMCLKAYELVILVFILENYEKDYDIPVQEA